MQLPSFFRIPSPERIEAALQLPSGFLDEIADQSDWSFVIKSHGLLEASLTHLLSRKGEPRLSDFFRRLPFGGNRNSKIDVARSLGLIDEPTSRFLVEFARVRNRLVHDVRLFRSTLDVYVSELDQASFRNVADAFGDVFDELRGREATEARRALAQLHLRALLQFGVMVSLGQMHFAVYPQDLMEVELSWEEADKSKWSLMVAVLLFAVAATSRKPNEALPEPGPAD